MLDTQRARIAGADRAEALAALDEVRGKVWHEGTVYEPAAAEVPQIVALALDPAVLVRPPLLQLLALIATGSPPPEFELGKIWTETARAMVRHRLNDYLTLLGDEDDDVRVAAACLAVSFRDRDAEVDVRRALEHRFAEEPSEIVRANLLGCLNVFLPMSHLELYDTALESDPSLLVRREAAHSLAAVQHGDTPTLAVATLLEAILNAPTLAPLYAGVAWNRSGLVADSCWALTRLGEAARPYVRHLEKLLRRADARDALAIGEAALLILFVGPASSRDRADLSPEQLSLLRTLVDSDAIWGRELPQMLAHYGLPRDQAVLRALLERS